MRNLLKPAWLLVLHCLPLMVLFFIGLNDYFTIHSILDDHALSLWHLYAGLLAFSVLSVAVYAIVLFWKKGKASVYYALMILLFKVSLLYLYTYFYESFMPFSIPEWMLSGSYFLYAGSFIMPTMLHALFIIILYFKRNESTLRRQVGWVSLLLIPALWYILFELIIPLRGLTESAFGMHLLIILCVLSTLLFVFIALSKISHVLLRKKDISKERLLIQHVLFCLVLPLFGLAVNNGDIEFIEKYLSENLLGDFSSSWFYVLAILNGFLLCLSIYESEKVRGIFFFLRSSLLLFTLYFFFVLIPFLPLSLLVIVIFGLGFLMLSPLFLLFFQGKILYDDFQWFVNKYSRKKAVITFVLSLVVLPLCVSIFYRIDKKPLNLALEYVYSPDYEKDYESYINLDRLDRILTRVEAQASGDFNLWGAYQPFLSSYYRFLNFDNLQLSTKKVKQLRAVFFGEAMNERFGGFVRARDEVVVLKDTKVESQYDASTGLWKSWIDLEMKNTVNWDDRTYECSFTLPEGAWISDYYLDVHGERKSGILAEKRAATWIFRQIWNTNKDPGILYYLDGNRIALKVYPFLAGEQRTTGFEISHLAPLRLNLDGQDLQLGSASTAQDRPGGEDWVYLDGAAKGEMERIEQKAYIHLLVDVRSDSALKSAQRNLNSFLKEQSLHPEQLKISLVGTYFKSISYDAFKQLNVSKLSSGQGFFLERALKKSIIDHFKSGEEKYPVFVVLSDEIDDAIMEGDFRQLSFMYPQEDKFYHYKSEASLSAYSLWSTEHQKLEDIEMLDTSAEVLLYEFADGSNRILKADSKPSLLIKESPLLKNGLMLEDATIPVPVLAQAKWQEFILDPEKKNRDYLDLIRFSFEHRLMTPLTSFIVLENAAQEAILLKKQQSLLKGEPNFDAGEVTGMSEPSFYLMLLLLVLCWLLKNKFS